jgi:inosine/xanthosine triphosphatase
VNVVQIAVGSQRKPKLGAVSAALDSIGTLLDPKATFEVVGVEVKSGVSLTPSSRAELMLGAKQRAEQLVRVGRQRGANWRFYVGLEGGLDVLQATGSDERRVFLESWAYVTDGGRGFWGRSGALEIPEELAREVLDRGVELSIAIDRFAGAVGIRDAQGAWGVLTRDLIGRQEAFRIAVIAAFAPFYNATLYGAAAAARGAS